MAAVGLAMAAAALSCLPAAADLTVFFDPAQVATLVSTGATSDTVSSEDYLFTYTRDKAFTGGVGLTNPIGRPVRVEWPEGVEAQYVTSGTNTGKARITVRRADGGVFDLISFTARLLANAGAGRAIEIVPFRNGKEPLNDPLFFDVSGSYGNEFSYDTSPNYLGSTAALTNYDAYVISLTLDYALTALTLQSPHVNHAPTDIGLANASVLENDPVGTAVGSLSTVDPDAGDTFTYALVGGVGGLDNGSFSVVDGELFAETTFDYEARSTYSIRVESADQDGLSTQRVLTVSVLDVDEAPVFQGLTGPIDGNVVLSWSSVTNHTYTIYRSTNLGAGYSILASNVPATPTMNVYTSPAQGLEPRFWTISTIP